MLELGLLNCGVFSVLKASARNCRRRSPFSPSAKLLNSEKSSCLVPGPRRMLRPELPKTNCAGATNALASNQRSIERWPEDTSPEAIRLGNCEPPPTFSELVCMVGVNGRPVKHEAILFSCQPPAISSTGLGAAVRKRFPLPKGISQVQPADTLCRT